MDISLLRTDEEMTEVYNRYVDTIYRIALMILKDVSRAEDVTQTVFIRLMMSGLQFESDEHMKAWLIVVARNICKDQFKSWWYSRRSDFKQAAELSYTQGTPGNDIWDKVISLDEKYKLPIYLHYYEGYKTEEISVMLGVNHATVRTRLRAAKKKLKRLFEEEIELE